MNKEFKVEAGNYVYLRELTRYENMAVNLVYGQAGGVDSEIPYSEIGSNPLIGLDYEGDVRYYIDPDHYTCDGYDIVPKDITEEFLEWYNRDETEEVLEDNTSEWYDYDKQEPIDGKNPIKDEVIQACRGSEDEFKNVSYATTVNNGSFDAHLCYILGEGSWFSADIRPLDYDKNSGFNKFKIQFSAICNKDSEIYHGTSTSQISTLAKLVYDGIVTGDIKAPSVVLEKK